ncbi:SGNH/GDSL hydrolase family protein [Myxococcus sp. AB025B]|uniref:SGNH/GDSL hydrolase family protein n=1 Tax=Myxococcus TaxID=32 RepID=UPI0011431B93|nr:SGNH/GDSL hydrolase family protein [Myxococcus sp. AB025B]
MNRKKQLVAVIGSAALVSACGHSAASVRAAASPVAQNGDIQWEVVDRFRLVKGEGSTEDLARRFQFYYDEVSGQINNEGLPETYWDEANERYEDEYLQVSSWKVRLNAGTTGKCQWKVAGSAPVEDECDGHVVEVKAPDTGVEVTRPDGSSATAVVSPRDILIASLGDSYSSGEGVPDLRRYAGVLFWRWTDEKWIDRRCHRSLFSGPGLAALMYAKTNPHVSVTHLTFTCSGALLDSGLLAPYPGAEKRTPALPAQVEALKSALTKANRVPEILTISAGGNDIGFADIVLAAATGSVKTVEETIEQRVEPGIASVVSNASVLKRQLEKIGVRSPETTILVTEYPNPTNLWRLPDTKDSSAAVEGKSPKTFKESCAPRKGVISFLPGAWGIGKVWQISAEELERIEARVATPLKTMSANLAQELGATLVTGVDEEFRHHGYCAPGLFPLDESHRVRWINTVRDSFRMTGGLNGAMHPNIRGQDSIARHLLTAILNAECTSGRIAAGTALHSNLCTSDAWKSGLPGFDATQRTPTGERFSE